MSGPATTLLLSTAAATAVFHTMIPDHWLPFVLIGRARGWNGRTVALVSGVSALIHAGLSVVLGFLALALSLTAVQFVGETLERASAALLVVFGLAYAFLSWRNRGHFHPGGALLHTAGSEASCSGEEGDADPEHLHYHADREWIRPRRWSAWGLALIIGLNPCVLILPTLLASAPHGRRVMLLVVAAYAVPTVLLMVGLSVAGAAGMARIRLPAVARHMELVSGLAVALLGVAYWLVE